MRDEPVTLSPRARALVAGVIAEVCEHRRWPLHAVNPRTQHVHVVLSSPGEPERALNDLKAWCTRRLREARLVGVGAVWTKHGSTRYINDADSFARAVWYVIEEQD